MYLRIDSLILIKAVAAGQTATAREIVMELAQSFWHHYQGLGQHF